MRLDKVVLNGFKSFADKTQFDFNERITSIVGPNGCGKSNIVDAVKWVLGDQSPKSLRSGQMADVIFSGSVSRKPSGMAQVSLVFSEVSGFGIEQDQLEISRRLYRSGDSEYLINNKLCRLKDIRNLFMDTGVGVRAYSIIEQGQIDQILYASKIDRRVIFEEAAGISKYKLHKKEALRKLERTEQNLLRLADIVTEVQKQLRSIKLQAGKARNYLQYVEQLKKLRLNYSLAEYHRIVTESKKRNHSLAKLQEEFASVTATVARNDTLVSELGKNIIETHRQINHWDNSLISAKSKIEQQSEHIRLLKSRIEELALRKTTGAEQIRSLDEQTARLADELAASQHSLQENDDNLKQANQQLAESDKAISRTNTECTDIEADLEDEKSGIIDIVRRTAQLHNELENISTYRNNLNGQKNRLNSRAEQAKAQLQSLLTEKAQYMARLNDTNKVLGELRQGLDTRRKQITEIDIAVAGDNKRLADARESRIALSSEFNILSDMETRRQGLSNSIVAILQASIATNEYDYIEGIVADIIRADADYAAAIEAALEGKTDALVINDTERFLSDDKIGKNLENRVKLICADKVEPFVDTLDLSHYASVHGRAVEFVNYDSRHAALAWKLLGRTIMVESIDAAIELSQHLGPQYSFITKAGEVFDGGQSISIGPVGKTAGLISRKSRLAQLQTMLAAVSQQLKETETELQKKRQQTEHLEKLCKDLRTAVYEANTEKVDTESKTQIIEQNIKRLTDEQPVIASEIEMLEQQISQSVQKEYDSRQKLKELEIINNQRNAHIEQLEAQFAEKKTLQAGLADSLTDLKVRIGQLSEQQKSIKQQIESLQSQLKHDRAAMESTKTELLRCDEQIAQAQRDILDAEAKISELLAEKENSQRLSTQMHEKVDELLGQQKETEDLLKQKQTQQYQVEQQIHQIQLELGQYSVKNEDLTQRVAEELDIDLAEAYKDFEHQDVDWDQLGGQIGELKGKIARLGNVNVDAISQQQELQERYDFLATQVEDLNKSKSQLQQLINKINTESEEKFRVTFEQVRENFRELFRKLFGGGRADIFLEDPDDILECGIEIMAKPPGKETRSISLLSGGEKSLTALGLLFAIFRSKPSPFCFLDEVDAALDEANNERFNMILQQFQKHSQFIVITHSKRTMSIADVLFGVTMQTQGVSKKISVKFDEADAEIDAAVA